MYHQRPGGQGEVRVAAWQSSRSASTGGCELTARDLCHRPQHPANTSNPVGLRPTCLLHVLRLHLRTVLLLHTHVQCVGCVVMFLPWLQFPIIVNVGAHKYPSGGMSTFTYWKTSSSKWSQIDSAAWNLTPVSLTMTSIH